MNEDIQRLYRMKVDPLECRQSIVFGATSLQLYYLEKNLAGRKGTDTVITPLLHECQSLSRAISLSVIVVKAYLVGVFILW